MPNIGESIGGGILFYSGATGLVAANSDIYTSVWWGPYDAEVVTDTAIGTGQANTTAITTNFTGFTAAKACSNFESGGFSDWYLPSKGELSEMWASGRTFLSGLDIQNNYWTSSESTPRTAWIQYFVSGDQSSLGGKYQHYRVRPIRTL